ncbi:MAG TPA: Tim44/TimA family putative adaptor protein [Stellaceae bacterium]|nr:Tim44/TimA family putative adaptor protein [Stellaceae bacterium]
MDRKDAQPPAKGALALLPLSTYLPSQRHCMSGGDFQLLGLVVFAVVTGILLLRLRSVLGRRTGTERRIDPFAPQPRPQAAPGPFAKNAPVIEGQAVPVPAAPARGPGAGAVKAADPSFDEAAFLKGARGAFEIVVNAFAAADTGALKPLLNPNVFDSFAGAIKARGGEKLPSPLLGIKSAEIVESAVEGATVLVTVKFASDQSSGGPADTKTGAENTHTEEHVDYWTFSRPLKSRDPNWILIATKSPDEASR